MILNKLKKKQCDDKGVLPFSKDSKIPPLWYLFREYIYIYLVFHYIPVIL